MSATVAVGMLVGVSMHSAGLLDGVAPGLGGRDQATEQLELSKVRGLRRQPPSKMAANESAVAAQAEETVGTIYSNLAMLYRTRGELDQAESMYRKAIDIHTVWEHRKSLAKDYNNLGHVYWSRGDLELAESSFRNSLGLHEMLGDEAGMADNYANLGSVYLAQGDLVKAEVMYRQALTRNRAKHRRVKLANNYNNLGLLYQMRGELTQARAMHQKAIAIYQAEK